MAHRSLGEPPHHPLGGQPHRRSLVLDILFDLALLCLAALAFALSFPGFASANGWFPLAYVALAPLFIVARRARWAATPFYGVFFGWLSYLLYNYWLGRFHPLTLFVVPPIHAAYFLVLLPLLKLADTAFPVHGYVLQALLWICYERFLKTEGFLAYSYGNLGYTQWQFLPLRADRGALGRVGRVGLVVFPSALLGSALRDGLRRTGGQPPPSCHSRGGVGRGVRRGRRLRDRREGGSRRRAPLEGRARPAEHGPLEGRRTGLRGESWSAWCARATRRSRSMRTWTS